MNADESIARRGIRGIHRRLRPLLLACAVAVAGCSDGEHPTGPRRPEGAPIDQFLLYARNWPTEEVELAYVRGASGSSVVLFRPARDGRPRVVLDTVGPGAELPEKMRVLLETFDVWALNHPNAPGAACRTVNGERDCDITWEDYSVVMLVDSGGERRVQRYTGLETRTASSWAPRGLGDYVLAWARELEGGR